MAGIALVLDLIRKNPSFNGQTFYSSGQFSAALASTAAASVAAGSPFASRALFGGSSVAHCDTGPPLTEDYLSSIRNAAENIFQYNNLDYSTKEDNIQLKPLFSAFQWKAFALTSLRSFLLFYLPIMGPRVDLDEEDDDFPQESSEEQHLDLVVPFKKSVKQIVREYCRNPDIVRHPNEKGVRIKAGCHE